MRRTVPLIVLTTCGLLAAANFYIRWQPLNTAGSTVLAWGTIVAAFSLGLGAVNLLQMQVRNVASRKNVINGVASIAAFVAMAVFGIISEQKGEVYNFLFTNMLQPLGDTVFSLLAFYIATASYRAFRARNLETFVLLGAALIMILGNTPFIGLISAKMPTIANWFLNTPTVAARRAISVSAAIGGLAAAIRAFVGLDTRITG